MCAFVDAGLDTIWISVVTEYAMQKRFNTSPPQLMRDSLLSFSTKEEISKI